MIRGDYMDELRIVPVNSNDADFLFCIMNNEVILARLHEIPTTVLTHLIAQMRERRYNSIMLFTDKDNVTAQKCYQKCGFDVCEELVETMSDNTNVERYKMVCKF